MSIGEKNTLLRLQRPSGTSGYEDVEPDIYGALRFGLSGAGESVQFGTPTAIASWTADIWYRSDVRADWRVMEVDTERVFQISAYGDPKGQKRDLRLLLTEIQ